MAESSSLRCFVSPNLLNTKKKAFQRPHLLPVSSLSKKQEASSPVWLHIITSSLPSIVLFLMLIFVIQSLKTNTGSDQWRSELKNCETSDNFISFRRKMER